MSAIGRWTVLASASKRACVAQSTRIVVTVPPLQNLDWPGTHLRCVLIAAGTGGIPAFVQPRPWLRIWLVPYVVAALRTLDAPRPE